MSQAIRYHSLDSLRAIMMLLGVVLHTAINYTETPIPTYFFKDSQTASSMDALVSFIHSFRMPVFFALAGFFAAMLCERLGPTGMFRHRMRRIALPFAIFWPVLAGLTIVNVVLASHYLSYGNWGFDFDLLEKSLAPQQRVPNPIHLWFLYYLLIFIVLSVPVCYLLRLMPRVRDRLRSGAGSVVRNPSGLLWLLLPLVLLGVRYPGGLVHQEISFTPGLRALTYEALFFVTGWYLYHHRTGLSRYGDQAWWFLAGGLLCFGAYRMLLGWLPVYPEPATMPLQTALALTINGTTVLMMAALIGLFDRYLGEHSPVLRYVTDASYWVYLVHLLFTVSFGVLLSGLDVGVYTKFFMVLALTSIVCFVSYHFWVRDTLIGVLLSGKRYPRTAIRDDENTDLEFGGNR